MGQISDRAESSVHSSNYITLYYFPTTHFYFPRILNSGHKDYEMYIKCLKNFPAEMSYFSSHMQ